MNPLLEAAKTLGDDKPDEDNTTSTTPTVNEPKVGSYEAFMSTFANPSRWAGRS